MRAYLAKYRAILAAALAYALIFQGFAAPLAHARALESARLDAAFAVICADDTASAHSENGQSSPHKKHQHECCLGANRDGANMPAIAAAFVSAFAPRSSFTRFIEPAIDHPRPQPCFAQTISPRGPPAFP